MSGERLAEQSDKYVKAMEDGKPGKAGFHLTRMQEVVQVRHMFNLPTNDSSKALCGAKTGLIRVLNTNVNCPECLSILPK